MKSLTVLIMLTLPLFPFAQGVFTNNTNTALQKVISDYPNHFRNIRGALLNEDIQVTDYASRIQIPGAMQAVITKYSSSSKEEIYSWKCVLAESEDFETTAKKYKDIYNQIRNSIVKIENEKPFILNGVFEPATEEKRFVSSAFNLVPSSGSMGKLKVEITMEYYVTEWRVSLLVYDKEEEELVMD